MNFVRRDPEKNECIKLQNCADLKFANIRLKPNANLVRGKLEKKEEEFSRTFSSDVKYLSLNIEFFR